MQASNLIYKLTIIKPNPFCFVTIPRVILLGGFFHILLSIMVATFQVTSRDLSD